MGITMPIFDGWCGPPSQGPHLKQRSRELAS